MSKQTIFTGSGVAIITPMNADGSVNYDKYRELVEWQIENGTDAIIACGTTGESSTLTDEEHIGVIRAAIEQTAGPVSYTHLDVYKRQVVADGRHMWRVLDNLFGNAVKYALDNTRVYVDLLCLLYTS